MKILFDNLLKGANYKGVGASPNYPARNLEDGFLRLRYQGTSAADTITINLDDTISINCFFMGYIGNVSDVGVTFYSGDTVRLVTLGAEHGTGEVDTVRIFETGVIAHFGAGPSDYFDDYDGLQYISRHFPIVTGIDRVVITIAGTNPFYIGGVAAGLCEDMPPAVGAWTDNYEDGSAIVRSSHGQVQQLYIEPFDRFSFSFQATKFQDFYRIKEACRSVGSAPVWVTFFEDSEDTFPPGYFSVTFTDGRREDKFYQFSIDFQEAR